MKGGERLTLECLEQGMRLETEALADLPHLLIMNALDYSMLTYMYNEGWGEARVGVPGVGYAPGDGGPG